MAGLFVSGVGGSYETLAVSKSLSAEKINKTKSNKDRIDISGQAREYLLASKALLDVPDVRTEKTQGLKAAFASGAYCAEPKDIADKILASFDAFF